MYEGCVLVGRRDFLGILSHLDSFSRPCSFFSVVVVSGIP